jgi:hypothetical protein
MNFELLPILTDYEWFQTRTFIWEFPIGSYVKLNSVVVAILVGVLKCRTHFWKRTTQESFQQSLVLVSMMTTITKNRIFFKLPKLLYFKPESAQI